MGQLQRRDEISSDLKWSLEDIYSSNELWEEDLGALKASGQSVLDLRGTLTSGENLLKALKLQEEISLTLDRVIAYALMRKDEDNANSLYQAYAESAMAVAVELNAAQSFFVPEILSLDPDAVQDWIKNEPGLKLYEHHLEDILRKKAHTLPAEQEQLLAAAGEMAQAPRSIFGMFNDADLKFPDVQNDAGEMVELTHGRYGQLLESQNRDVRQGAFDALYATYTAWKNTLGATFTSAVKKERFFSKAREYESSLAAALHEDNVNPEVYTNLIDSIHDHLPLMHRYVRLRKKLLGLEELHMYDLYVSMVADEDMEFSRDGAVEVVRAGLHPLGTQYLSDMSEGFTDGWIDWLENRGKTSGAYSWGTYGVHPYVLLNYQGTLNDVFTLAHELGHAMHSFYSGQEQEFVNAQYTIFVAEVASTLNEALVMDDLLQKTEDPKKRAYLLNHFLEQFRGTVFRQTMFAEFEMIVHGKIGAGESLTSDRLSEIYYDLNKKYYGPDMVVDEAIAMEWARIPHFYRPFYVYKYATGFSAAVSLSRQILAEGEPAVQRYLDFLGSGGSDYPVNQLQKAGVDMSKPEPIIQAMAVFEELLSELEQLAEAGL